MGFAPRSRFSSDAFEAKHAALMADDPAAAEDKDEYLAEQILRVPKDARWSHLKANAKQPTDAATYQTIVAYDGNMRSAIHVDIGARVSGI